MKGFAQVAGTTLTGLTGRNLKENFAIFGATLVDLVNGPIKAAIEGINTVLDLGGKFVSGKLFATTAGHGRHTRGVDHQATVRQPGEARSRSADVLGATSSKPSGLLLALKGVFSAFGLIGRGVALALTPMGLLVVAVAGITAAFGFFRRTNEKFAATFKVMTNQVKPAVAAFFNLGRTIKNAFFGGGAGGGGQTILTRIGDGLPLRQRLPGPVSSSASALFADILSGNIASHGFSNFAKSLDDAGRRPGCSRSSMAPTRQAKRRQLKAEVWSFILNVLEEHVPRARWSGSSTGPFLNIAKTITGFIGNICVGQDRLGGRGHLEPHLRQVGQDNHD